MEYDLQCIINYGLLYTAFYFRQARKKSINFGAANIQFWELAFSPTQKCQNNIIKTYKLRKYINSEYISSEL